MHFFFGIADVRSTLGLFVLLPGFRFLLGPARDVAFRRLVVIKDEHQHIGLSAEINRQAAGQPKKIVCVEAAWIDANVNNGLSVGGLDASSDSISRCPIQI